MRFGPPALGVPAILGGDQQSPSGFTCISMAPLHLQHLAHCSHILQLPVLRSLSLPIWPSHYLATCQQIREDGLKRYGDLREDHRLLICTYI